MAYFNEYLLTTNAFEEPTHLTDSQAVGLMILRLLLMEKGTDSCRPNKGVGLADAKYRYMTEDDISDLQSEINSQIRTYLSTSITDALGVKLYFKENNKTHKSYLVIKISIDDLSYVYETEDSNNPIELGSIK